MAKKYIVRDGFVVGHQLKTSAGETYERTYNGGEEVTLDDDVAALHLHKLEFANPKDADAARAAEKASAIAAKAASSPAQLVGDLVAALGQAQAAAAAIPAA